MSIKKSLRDFSSIFLQKFQFKKNWFSIFFSSPKDEKKFVEKFVEKLKKLLKKLMKNHRRRLKRRLTEIFDMQKNFCNFFSIYNHFLAKNEICQAGIILYSIVLYTVYCTVYVI